MDEINKQVILAIAQFRFTGRSTYKNVSENIRKILIIPQRNGRLEIYVVHWGMMGPEIFDYSIGYNKVICFDERLGRA